VESLVGFDPLVGYLFDKHSGLGEKALVPEQQPDADEGVDQPAKARTGAEAQRPAQLLAAVRLRRLSDRLERGERQITPLPPARDPLDGRKEEGYSSATAVE